MYSNPFCAAEVLKSGSFHQGPAGESADSKSRLSAVGKDDSITSRTLFEEVKPSSLTLPISCAAILALLRANNIASLARNARAQGFCFPPTPGDRPFPGPAR